MRRIILAVALIALCGLLPAPASAVVNPGCLNDPKVGITSLMGDVYIPVLTTTNEPLDFAVWGVLLADCPNTTITARTPGGGLITVPLNKNLPAVPPLIPQRLGGTLTLPLGYGAGLWQLTKITSGGSSKTLHHPFDVSRGFKLTLDNPAAVAAPNPVAIFGTVKRYTSTGTLTASPNTTVAIYNPNPLFSDLAYLKTNSAGVFSGTVAMPPGDTTFRARLQTTAYNSSPTRIASVTEPLPPPPTQLNNIVYKSVAYVNEWYRVDALTTPGTRWTDLQKPTTEGWKTTGSYGYSNSAGTVTRWWKPASTGSYTLRLRAGGGSTVYKTLKTITVKSKQTIPTYVDAKVKPTNGGTVYGGTPMTLDGHLKVRYNNGTIGPYAGQQIRIQARPAGTSAWVTTIATVTTNSSGYFLTHWAMRYQSNVEIRFLFLSPYITIKNSQVVKAVTVSP